MVVTVLGGLRCPGILLPSSRDPLMRGDAIARVLGNVTRAEALKLMLCVCLLSFLVPRVSVSTRPLWHIASVLSSPVRFSSRYNAKKYTKLNRGVPAFFTQESGPVIPFSRLTWLIHPSSSRHASLAAKESWYGINISLYHPIHRSLPPSEM
jgi:hypothetical protein